MIFNLLGTISICPLLEYKCRTIVTYQSIEVLYRQYETTEIVCLRCGKVFLSSTERTIMRC